MRLRWFHFLTNLPVRDPLARRQVPLLLTVLGCLFVASLARLLFFFGVDQATIGVIPTLAVDVISLVAPAIAILLLFRGHFAAAVLLAAVAMLLTLVIAIAANGLRDSGMLPLVFALPIVFTGLLLDWRGLALVTGMSCAVVIGVAVLESQDSPWVGMAPSPEIPASMASIFVFVTGLLVILLSRFRQDYQRELAEHLRVAATLRQSEVRFSTAFRASPAALVMIRLRDGVLLDVNATFARLLGYTSDELIGQRGDGLEVFPGSDQSTDIVAFLRNGETVSDQEMQLRTKDGVLRTVLLSLEVLDLDGEPCVLGMAVDITDRKRAEYDLQQTTLNLQALVNDHAQLLAREQQARQVAEALHTTGQLLARPLNLEAILETLLDVLQQLIPYDSANIMLPDGASGFRVRHWRGYERWTDPALVTALVFDPMQKPLIQAIVTTQRSVLVLDTHQEPAWTPMLGPDHIRCWLGVPLIAGNTVVGIYSIDRQRPNAITEADVRLAETLGATAATAIERAQLFAQVQHERGLLARRVAERTADLSLANAELTRAARLKDEFLASMSHELRTPLTGILGRAEALQEGIYGPVTAEQVTSLHSIAESGQHLLTLINDILDLSKIESGRLTLEYATLDIDLLGTMAVRMVAQIAHAKHISLTSSFDGQVQRVHADERRLKQILVNLLANAVKFTLEGGKVGLEVQGSPEQQAVTFTVWDTGIGIAAEDLPKLFQPFVQLDSRLNRQYTGTGLGLALVARLAQAHGGSVAVESTPGQGSRFSVTLPWNPTPPPTSPVSATAAVDTARPAVRQALVVEDSPTAAAQITRYLRELGARVEIHPYGTGTVERAITLQPDVIVLDILLPDDDGWAVLRQLKAEPRTRDIPVLVVSVVDAPEQARTQGAAAMLVKPIDRPTLEQALRQILARPATPPVPMALVVAPHLGRPRILLADDNEETLETLGDYLRAKGYDLRVARNGREAIVQAQEELPDVILMDIQMPGMDGLEAIRRIRADAAMAHVPILAVTALAMPADRERCLAAGADAYLPKPINLRTLTAMIESHRQQRAGPATDHARNDEPSLGAQPQT